MLSQSLALFMSVEVEAKHCSKLLDMERVPVFLVLLFLLVPTNSTSGDGSGAASGEGPGAEETKIPLNFIFISSDNPRLKSSGSIPAVDIALEMVEKSGALPGYSLHYNVPLDSQVGPTS